ncbi:MAG: fatty acid desaturase, partial [Candidatus Puniceispirillaceae bacterium]
MRLTNHHGLLWLLAHFALIASMAWASFSFTGVIGWLAITGQGIGLCFLFCAMHEAGHGTAFRSKALNKLVTSFVGLLLFMGPLWFQSFHAAHHRHTHDPERDPELATSKPQNWRQYLFHLSGIIIWTTSIRTLIGNAIRPPRDHFIPASSRARITREARLMLLAYGVIFTSAIII